MPNINDFKAKLGARSNQFKVTMPFPVMHKLVEK